MSEDRVDLLVLRTEDRRFAVPMGLVREVLRAVWIEPLPGAPAVVEGLIDYRGVPTPVFDARVRLGLPIRPLHPRDHLVVLDLSGRLVALRVDHAERLVAAPVDSAEAEAEPLSPSFPGVAQLEGALLLVHDPARFLDADEGARLEAALEERPSP